MWEYAYLIAGVVLGAIFLIGMYLVHRHRSGTESAHSWMSYLLVWPLILDVDKSKREGRFLTKREWLGWGLVILIAVLAIVFTPSGRGG
jgi:uncharacterized membrane protein (UPF0136 family)